MKSPDYAAALQERNLFPLSMTGAETTAFVEERRAGARSATVPGAAAIKARLTAHGLWHAFLILRPRLNDNRFLKRSQVAALGTVKGTTSMTSGLRSLLSRQ